MTININNSSVEQLLDEITQLTGESRTEAVRKALEERHHRLATQAVAQDRVGLLAFLQKEVWPQIPADQIGVRLTKEALLGFLNLLQVAHVHEVGGGPDDVLEGRAGFFEQGLNVLENLLGLSAGVVNPDNVALLVEGSVAGDKEKIPNADCARVQADRRLQLLRSAVDLPIHRALPVCAWIAPILLP